MNERLAWVVQVATAISTLAAVASVWLAVRIYRRQINAQVFMSYTQRYETIMSGVPDNAFRARFNMGDALPPQSAALSLSVLRYLNLCSEEYYLCKTGHLDRSLWAI